MMHRQNYRLWEQQEVLQERRRLRSEQLFPRARPASSQQPATSQSAYEPSLEPELDQQQEQREQQHIDFQSLPKALLLQVAGLLDVSSRCSLGQCNRAMLELVCTYDMFSLKAERSRGAKSVC